MKTKVMENKEALISQLEYELSETFGSEFVEDIQRLCGIKTAITKEKQNNYLHMLRGAWYAYHQVYNLKK